MICCCRVSLCTLCCRARVNSDSIVDCRALCSLSLTGALSLSHGCSLSLSHGCSLSHTDALSLSRADALYLCVSLSRMLSLSVSLSRMLSLSLTHGCSLFLSRMLSLSRILSLSLSGGLLSYSCSSYFLLCRWRQYGLMVLSLPFDRFGLTCLYYFLYTPLDLCIIVLYTVMYYKTSNFKYF
jgi:hypothetical protein